MLTQVLEQAPPATSPHGFAEVYGSINYLGSGLERLHAYRQQILYSLRSRPSNVLIVGKGDGFVVDLLERAGVAVTTLDIDGTLEPNIVASVESIPIDDGAFSVSVCCQVLEHLPFNRFLPCLRELHRVTRDRLVLSVPDVRPFITLRLRLPKIQIDRQFSLPRIPGRVVTPERFSQCPHHWEIGFRGTEFRSVRSAISQAGWRLLESRRVSDLAWHCFFHCQRIGL